MCTLVEVWAHRHVANQAKDTLLHGQRGYGERRTTAQRDSTHTVAEHLTTPEYHCASINEARDVMASSCDRGTCWAYCLVRRYGRANNNCSIVAVGKASTKYRRWVRPVRRYRFGRLPRL